MATTGAPNGRLDDFYKEGHGAHSKIGVLLLHGFTGSPASMRPWADFLNKKGLTVAVPRIPGHGTRWQDLNQVSWREWTDRAEQELRKLKAQSSEVFIFGLSMGGANTLFTAANSNVKISGIVLVNPMIHITDPAIKLINIIKYLVPKRPSVGDDIKKPGITEWGYDALPTKGVAELNKLLKATRKSLPEVKVPTLLFHSVEDHVLPVSNTELIMKEIGAVDKARIELGNSYHVATLDYDAETIFESSYQFILEKVSNLD